MSPLLKACQDLGTCPPWLLRNELGHEASFRCLPTPSFASDFVSKTKAGSATVEPQLGHSMGRSPKPKQQQLQASKSKAPALLRARFRKARFISHDGTATREEPKLDRFGMSG